MKRSILAIIVVLIMALGAQVSLYTNSFPGYGGNSDCTDCHNEPATAYNASWANAAIAIDGVPNDIPWTTSTAGRRMEIPVGATFGSMEQFVSVEFGQNSTDLWISFGWSDATINGSDTERGGVYDGVAIMWNINSTNFNEFYTAMHTPAVNQWVDTWLWKPTSADQSLPFNSTFQGHTYDNAFNGLGWADSDVSQNVYAAASHGYIGAHDTSNYWVEMDRKLTTSDPYDVQFSNAGYYQFMIAIFNETSGSHHYMSFEHSVFIYNPNDPNVPPVSYPATATEVVFKTANVYKQYNTTSTTTTGALPWFTSYSFLAIFMLAAATLVIRRKKNN